MVGAAPSEAADHHDTRADSGHHKGAPFSFANRKPPASKHVFQIGDGVVAVRSCRLDQARDGGVTLSRAQPAGEEPVVVNWNLSVGHAMRQCHPAFGHLLRQRRLGDDHTGPTKRRFLTVERQMIQHPGIWTCTSKPVLGMPLSSACVRCSGFGLPLKSNKLQGVSSQIPGASRERSAPSRPSPSALLKNVACA